MVRTSDGTPALDWRFSWFSSISSGIFQESTSFRPRLLSYRSFPIYYSRIIVTYDTIQSELVRESQQNHETEGLKSNVSRDAYQQHKQLLCTLAMKRCEVHASVPRFNFIYLNVYLATRSIARIIEKNSG
jgi:hypothetical protein